MDGVDRTSVRYRYHAALVAAAVLVGGVVFLLASSTDGDVVTLAQDPSPSPSPSPSEPCMGSMRQSVSYEEEYAYEEPRASLRALEAEFKRQLEEEKAKPREVEPYEGFYVDRARALVKALKDSEATVNEEREDFRRFELSASDTGRQQGYVIVERTSAGWSVTKYVYRIPQSWCEDKGGEDVNISPPEQSNNN